MSDKYKLLEAKMTPEERSLFELFKSQIGKEFDLEKLLPGEATRRWLLTKKYITGYDGNITLHDIRRWAIANEDFNPLWWDEETAKQSRWSGFTTPPLLVMGIDDGVTPVSWLTNIVYDDNNVLNTAKYPNFLGGMQASTEFEFNEAIRPGDTITFKWRCTDIWWKQGKSARLMFAKGETEYVNQFGRIVTICRQLCVYRFK